MDRNDMLAALKAVQVGDMTPEAALGLRGGAGPAGPGAL